ncbi:ArsR/SmtB family transcription factor [Sandaracinobacteroides hominis]|uniref:ArsR/SmtB family transcription factor n=1 Tax=Sandaracinobacteroides hominis TaxID=2780086 RepID=UPI002E2DB43C|nr:metalloregulator ArsR/SmtB family transcription factor [Sandaracinobacteroides hominis]
MPNAPLDPVQFAAQAGRLAETLALLASAPRLMILCRLSEAGEMPVGALADSVGLSQSALSQHLARLRADGLVATTRERQSIRYRIADPRVLQLMETLHTLYCTQEA